MNEELNWGILGTGSIAKKFAGDLPHSRSGKLVAVGSRSRGSADAFAAEFGGQGRDSYQAMVDDPAVHAVYISLPNQLHKEWTLKALAAGKHVLCEKPMALNVGEAEQMFLAAERSGLVMVEAFMYRAHPLIPAMLREIAGGAIGEVRLIRSNFSFCREASKDDGRYHAEWGGGALMDVGCYCVNLIMAVAGGEPSGVTVSAHMHEFGVDDYAVGTLSFPNNVLATFSCGMRSFGDWHTYIGGSEGWIEVDAPWFGGHNSFVVVKGQEAERRVVQVEESRPLYAVEADRFADVVLKKQQPWITKGESLATMRVLDELRRQAGLPV